VIVSGPPWDLLVAVEWLAHATPRAGEPYLNPGAHIIRIRRGRVVYLHAYEDSQKVAEACRQMAAAGIEEAAAERNEITAPETVEPERSRDPLTDGRRKPLGLACRHMVAHPGLSRENRRHPGAEI